MSEVDPTWIVDRLLVHFVESLSQAIGDSEISIEALISDSNMIDVLSLQPQERQAFEAVSVRDILMQVIPGQVSFEEERLYAWASDAFQFYLNNSRHDDFLELFSSGLNYAVILQDMLLLDWSTIEFRVILSDMTGYEFNRKNVGESFPLRMEEIVLNLCELAIPDALRLLGRDLVATARGNRSRSTRKLKAERGIRRDPSFADREGVFPFRQVGGKLELGKASETKRSIDYRKQLDRAIERVRGSHIIARIHNLDPEIVALFEEYYNELSIGFVNESAVTLWVVGQDIDSRIRYAQSSTEELEKFDDNTLHYLMTFLTAHNLYLQSFPEIERLAKDLTRSAALYQGLDEKNRNAPWSILGDLSKDDSIFESRTQHSLEKTADAVDRPDTEKTKGLVGIAMGLLRGALRTMGATALEKVLGAGSEEFDKEAVNTLDQFLAEPGLERSIVLFFKKYREKLVTLSLELPPFFHWIRTLLAMIGLGS